MCVHVSVRMHVHVRVCTWSSQLYAVCRNTPAALME